MNSTWHNSQSNHFQHLWSMNPYSVTFISFFIFYHGVVSVDVCAAVTTTNVSFSEQRQNKIGNAITYDIPATESTAQIALSHFILLRLRLTVSNRSSANRACDSNQNAYNFRAI